MGCKTLDGVYFASFEGCQHSAAVDPFPTTIALRLTQAIETVESLGPLAADCNGLCLSTPCCELQRRMAESSHLLTGSQVFSDRTRWNGDDGEKVMVARSFVDESLAEDVPARLVGLLDCVCFEAKKDAMRFLSTLLREAAPLGTDTAVAGYLIRHPSMVALLLDGCGKEAIFAHCSEILRGCCGLPTFAKAFLNVELITKMFELAQNPNFEISSQAFASMGELFLSNTGTAEQFLLKHFDSVFDLFHGLLKPETDYVVKRQALRLMADILLRPEFRNVMLVYAINDVYLRINMNVLRDSSRTVRIGAFHIFKIFAANPNKPIRVQSILHRNKYRLLELIHELSQHTRGDESLLEDLSTVNALLYVLDAPVVRRTKKERAATW